MQQELIFTAMSGAVHMFRMHLTFAETDGTCGNHSRNGKIARCIFLAFN